MTVGRCKRLKISKSVPDADLGRRVRVKICGITDTLTALAAVEAGADALGFVFATSRRQVTPEIARGIIQHLPPFVTRVGVFVNTPPAEVADIAAYCGLSAIQLSDDEEINNNFSKSPYHNLPVIQTLRVGGGRGLPRWPRCQADAFLFDTYKEGTYGGTGEVFDWRILQNVDCPKPVILAGGLNAANVRAAVKLVKPYAVDVSGGVETGGHKDIGKIKEFIVQAKGVLI